MSVDRAEMVAAHLADRERLVRTHRDLAAVICEVRGLAEAEASSPLAQRILAAVGDTGVCSLTAADAFEALLDQSSLGSPEVRAAAALTPRADVERMMRRVRELEAADMPGDCDPAWAVPSSSPTPCLGRDIATLPDLNSYEEER